MVVQLQQDFGVVACEQARSNTPGVALSERNRGVPGAKGARYDFLVLVQRAGWAATLVVMGCQSVVAPEPGDGQASSSSGSALPTSGSDSSEGVTTASTTTGSTPSMTEDTTTGLPVDPPAACGAFQTQESCPYEANTGVYCGWVSVTPVAIEDGACVLGDAVGSCVPLTGDSTAEGCSWTVGCESYPYFVDLDGQLGAFFQCGGSPPIGGEPCTFVEPGVCEPAACGCICEGNQGSSSGGGETSMGSTSGASTGTG